MANMNYVQKLAAIDTFMDKYNYIVNQEKHDSLFDAILKLDGAWNDAIKLHDEHLETIGSDLDTIMESIIDAELFLCERYNERAYAEAEKDSPEAREERCRDCAYLVESADGKWVCDDCGRDIHEIFDEDCSANCKF